MDRGMHAAMLNDFKNLLKILPHIKFGFIKLIVLASMAPYSYSCLLDPLRSARLRSTRPVKLSEAASFGSTGLVR